MSDLDHASTVGVLDINHGGLALAERLAEAGFDAFAVDIYRTRRAAGAKVPVRGIDAVEDFDALVVPVHLPPNDLVRRAIEQGTLVLSHHEAAGYLVEKLGLARGMKAIEITGTVGKTTTAFALAKIAEVAGEKVLLHTSNGLYLDGIRLESGLSITPASVLTALGRGKSSGVTVGIFEISLGVCGFGHVAGLTSLERDYTIAGGAGMASEAKLESLAREGKNKKIVCPAGVEIENVQHPMTFGPGGDVDYAGDRIRYGSGTIELEFTDVLKYKEYRSSVLCAAAIALAAGYGPDPVARGIGNFDGVEGRMMLGTIEGRTLIDNSNSGLAGDDVAGAIRYAGRHRGKRVLVLGEEAHNVCSGLDPDSAIRIAEAGGLEDIVLVGGRMRKFAGRYGWAESLNEGLKEALARTSPGDTIVSCVKTWR